MREVREWAEAGPANAGPEARSRSSCGGARVPRPPAPSRSAEADVGARRGPLSTGRRGPPPLAPLGAAARSRLRCPGGRPTPPADARGGRRLRRRHDSPKCGAGSVGRVSTQTSPLWLPGMPNWELVFREKRRAGQKGSVCLSGEGARRIRK